MTKFRLRRKREWSGETLTGQMKRQTQRPTMKWTFFQFRRVREFLFVDGSWKIKLISNLNDELKMISQLFGREYEKYYC